ncbi:MAG: ABC transporter substrate-binding protein [Thiolinea sp.]
MMLWWLVPLNVYSNDSLKNQAYLEPFRILLPREPLGLDFQAYSQFTTLQLGQYTHDPLFTLKNGEAIPVLIDHYEWQTPTRWLFALKKAVKFHDGTELTSQDVVATFNRAFRLKNNTYKFIKDYRITALSKYEFQIDTEKPNSELLWDLEDVLILKHTAENLDNGVLDKELIIGTGPYQLIDRQGFKRFDFKSFPDYHRGEAYIRQVVLSVETDEEKQVQSFLQGDADMIYILSEGNIEYLKGKANITQKTNHHLRMIFLDVYREQSPYLTDHDGNMLARNPFKEIKVRQAISKALDREVLILNMFGVNSIVKPAGQLVNENSRWFDPTLNYEHENLAEARDLLREAGYPDGFQVIVHNVDTPRRELILKLLAEMLEKVGIVVKIAMVPLNEYIERMNNHEYAVSISSYTTDGNLAEMLAQKLYSGAKGNNGRYSNALHDQFIDEAMVQTSDILKERLLHKAQRVAMEDLALIPLYFESDNWAIRPGMIYVPTDQYYTEAYYVRPN